MKTDVQTAETIALKAIGFIVSDPQVCARFLNQTGMSGDDMKRSLSDPQFLASTLDFLLCDESLLMVFCQNSGIDPAVMAPARRKLPGASDYY